MPTPNRPLPQNKYSEQYIQNSSFDEDFGVQATEILGFDGVSLQRMNAVNLALQIDYAGGSNPIYLGIASPGTLTSDAKWQIKKLTFDVSDRVTSIQYANGTADFTGVWDDRVSLSYT